MLTKLNYMYDNIFNTYLHNPEGHIFYTFLKKNKYFTENILKFIKPTSSNSSHSSLKHLTLSPPSPSTNETILKNLKTTDIFIIGTEPLPTPPKNVPAYPIITPTAIILTPPLFIQLNGIDHTNLIPNILIKIKHIIGGFMIPSTLSSKLPSLLKHTTAQSYKHANNSKTKALLNTGLTSNHTITKIVPIKQHFLNNYHGWLSKDTAYNLKYALNHFKPKTVLELGSWLGKSAHYMKTLSPNITLYCYDKFQNVCLTPYSYNDPTPLDRFYFNFLRYETFWSNMNKFDNVYAIQEDAYKSLDMMDPKKIEMIYIDFIKSETKLMKFLERIFKLFPDTVIVGDDFVFETVKKAFKKELTLYKKYVGILDESYIISPRPLTKEYYSEYKNDITNEAKKNPYLETTTYLSKGKFPLAIRTVKKHKLDLNKNKDEFTLNNTLYHEFVMKAKDHLQSPTPDNLNTLLQPLYDYQAPKLVYNVLLLTYKDYLEHDIDFQ